MNKEMLSKKNEDESKNLRRITNNDLVCKTCISKSDDSIIFGNTSKCDAYESKPNKVLLGKDCDLYEAERDR